MKEAYKPKIDSVIFCYVGVLTLTFLVFTMVHFMVFYT